MSQASTGGFDFKASLSDLLGAYQSVSVARLEVDKAKYAAAAQNQRETLFSPEGLAARDAAVQSAGRGNSGMNMGGVNMLPVLAVGALIGGGLLLYKVLK